MNKLPSRYTYSGFPFYNYANGEGSSGGSSSANLAINTIFDGTFFNGEGQTVVNKLEELIADHNQIKPTGAQVILEIWEKI